MFSPLLLHILSINKNNFQKALLMSLYQLVYKDSLCLSNKNTQQSFQWKKHVSCFCWFSDFTKKVDILTIDMRRLSRTPPPLLPVVSCTINSALLYIMVARNRNTIWPPSTATLSLYEGTALSTNSSWTQSAHNGKRGGGRSRYYSDVYGPNAAQVFTECSGWWPGCVTAATSGQPTPRQLVPFRSSCSMLYI
jgi:hypothetical protein